MQNEKNKLQLKLVSIKKLNFTFTSIIKHSI
jgi:hypothetical protein